MAKSNIYIYTYNNYFNRIVKKESNLANYGTPEYVLTNTNFDYADGVSTSHVFNYNGNGDYVIVTDEENNILHRWFVIENKKTRGGQYIFTLRRDLFVDFYDLIVNAPMIMNKGWLNKNSSLLYNNENFSFNQIKKEETLLQDASKEPWYIVYFAKNTPKTEDKTFSLGGDRVIVDAVSQPINQSIYAPGATLYNENITYKISSQSHNWYGKQPNIWTRISPSGAYSTDEIGNAWTNYDYIWFDNAPSDIEIALDSEFNNKYSYIYNLDTEHQNPAGIETTIQKLLAANGKYVKDGNNNVYLINVSEATTAKESYALNNNVTDYMKARINDTSLTRTSGSDWGDEAFGIEYDEKTYVVTATLDSTATLKWTLDFANKTPSNDGTFNVITFPAGDTYTATSSGDFIMTDDIAQKFIASLRAELGTFIYDVQLIPYCPIIRAMDGWEPDYNMPVFLGYQSDPSQQIIDKEIYEYHNTGAASYTPCLLFYYIKDTTFTFNINKTINLDSYSNDAATNIKLNNECNLYRLVSPNYNGQFEFSVAKNGGVNYFNVDVTLRPYNPYIHVNPNFKNMYGNDYDDSRGLICNGDFSLPMVTDAFTEYELNNKNYQQIFNRQIEHMDFTQEQERIGAGVNMIAGTVSGAAMGALAGSRAGASGAIAGGFIGGGSSLAGGIVDYMMMEKRQREDKDLAIDNFTYQLGNIKARPYSITKVTPYTANNKKFPFLEKYTATNEEISILANKIAYNSFTVNSVSTIQDHINARPLNTKKFVSGILIRLEGTGLANNEVFEIYDELKKGCYI